MKKILTFCLLFLLFAVTMPPGESPGNVDQDVGYSITLTDNLIESIKIDLPAYQSPAVVYLGDSYVYSAIDLQNQYTDLSDRNIYNINLISQVYTDIMTHMTKPITKHLIQLNEGLFRLDIGEIGSRNIGSV